MALRAIDDPVFVTRLQTGWAESNVQNVEKKPQRAKVLELRSFPSLNPGIRQSSAYLVGSNQTLRRLRPLALRALRTLRPPRVAMRARNPWVRLRFRLLGWNVRFMVGSVWFQKKDAWFDQQVESQCWPEQGARF